MTLGDFIKRVDLERDKDKIVLFRDELCGWCNTELEVSDDYIVITMSNDNSPFSDDK